MNNSTRPIPDDLLVEVLNYLVSRPYAEVWQMIQALTELQPETIDEVDNAGGS